MFYEMLTGEVPVGAFDPPSQRSENVDARLDGVVMRALASDPDRRYQSASEIGGEVSDISSSVEVVRPPEIPHMPGPSTIMERGVGAVADGVKGLFAGNPYRGGHDPDLDEVVSGDTYVTLTRHQIENNQLPDCCMVCGKHTKRRVSKEFEHTPEWAGFFLVVLFILFFPLGILMAVMVNKKVRMNCPICVKHSRHWSNLAWFASTGWIIMVLGILGSVWLGGGFDETKSRRRSATAAVAQSGQRSLDDRIDQFADSISDAVDQATDQIDDAVDDATQKIDDAIEGRTEETTESAASTLVENTQPQRRTSNVNSVIIVFGILGSIALYVVPLIWMCCTRVAVEKITDKTVTFKRASTAFAISAQQMQGESFPRV